MFGCTGHVPSAISEPAMMPNECIKVFVRIRPIPPQTKKAAYEHEMRGEYNRDLSPSIYSHTQKCNRVMASSDEHGERERLQFFDYDGVVEGRCSNQDVWEVVGVSALNYFLQGTDATIFSYGPTGSGCAFTE